MKLRKIKREDEVKIAALIRAVLEEFGIDKPGTVYTDPTTDHLYDLFSSKTANYWVAELDGEIVGGCGYYPTAGLENGCAELVKLYISKDARGIGLGRKLMQLTIIEAEKAGYHSLYLETLPELNSAIGLYKSLGFNSLGAPLGSSGHFACNLWMLKQL